ncbi:cytochrome P450 4C1-like [Aricia agestis]|uniref:cytochrome P450 4C1-like n=1 Tax=Aricia agestis TaxID=91739 RepID=UPI001C203491|nr:cytochrome P450 4C1-like [Aricia agestis]
MLFSVWLILCALLVFVLSYKLLIRDDDFFKVQGPKGLFLIGNSLDFLKNRVDTFAYFRYHAQRFKELYKISVGSFKCMIVYSPEYVETLLSGIQYHKKGRVYDFLKPWLKDGLLISKGLKWQHRRKILTPAFHFNILRHFYTTILKKCDMLVAQLEPEVQKEKTDVLAFVADFTLNTICETAMGTSVEDSNVFGRKYRHAVHELGMFIYERTVRVLYHSNFIFKFSYLARKQNEHIATVASFRNKVVNNRRRNRCKIDVDSAMANSDSDIAECGQKKLAMLDILLKAEDEKKIDEEGISEEVDTFTFEGHDTTAAALQYIFMLLANHEKEQEQIVEEIDRICGGSDRALELADLTEMKYLECCIKEALRLYPPVFFITRNVDTPFELKDGMLVNNTEMVVSIFDIQRRADQFVEPLKFVPERFMTEPTWHRYAYIPFSAGPRNCIGQKFAMMEMKLAVASVLRKYRLRPVTKPDDIVFILDLILRPQDPIYVKFESR